MASDFVLRLAIIAKRQRRIGKLLDQLQPLRERNDYEMDALLRELGVGSKALDDPLGRYISPADRREKKLKKNLAEKGVSLLEIHRASDGGWIVRIDRGAPFPLSQLLGNLLLLLATGTAPSTDDKVGWRPPASIISHLAGFTVGRDRTNHSISQLIYRLRLQLLLHGENDQLIQKQGPLGYRFALRKDGKLVTDT